MREKEETAIETARRLGFVQIAVLQGHARDLDSHLRDLVIMEALLGKWFAWWPFDATVRGVEIRCRW